MRRNEKRRDSALYHVIFFVRASYSIFNAVKMVNYCVYASCTNTNFRSGHCLVCFLHEKRNEPPRMRSLSQVKRRDFETATSATTGVGVVCEAHFKQDYPPIICLCKIYNLLLKSNVSLRICLAETAG